MYTDTKYAKSGVIQKAVSYMKYDLYEYTTRIERKQYNDHNFFERFYTTYGPNGIRVITTTTRYHMLKALFFYGVVDVSEHDRLTDERTVQVFYQHFIEEQSYTKKVDNPRISNSLTIDDLLDLYNFALKDNDTEYLKYIKDKLLNFNT